MAWINIEMKKSEFPSQKEIDQIIDYRRKRAKARFYTDENFPTNAISLLRRLGGVVKTVYDEGTNGFSDEAHAAYALRNKLVLVTCDRDFLDSRRFPLIHCPAIFVFDFGGGSEEEIIQAFRCLISVFDTPQFYDKWCKVDARRDCWISEYRYQDGSTSRTRMRYWQDRYQEWID